MADELEPEVSYGAGVVSASSSPDAAQAFVDDLADGGCAGALREAGFGAAAVRRGGWFAACSGAAWRWPSRS